MKFKVWEFFLALILLGGMGTSGWFLYKDLTQIDTGQGTPIGTLEFKKNAIQRKFSDRVIWQEIQTQYPLYDNDSIRTLANAQAVLKLQDGTVITLEDNSLVTLQWLKNRTIDFQGGNISASRAGVEEPGQAAVFIRSKDAVVTLQNASLQVNQNSDGQVGIAVTEGKAELQVSGKTAQLDVQTQATIPKESQAVEIKTIPVVLKAPGHQAVILTAQNPGGVNFQWTLPGTWQAGALELSPDPSFTKIQSETLTAQTQERSLNLVPGAYYWRVKGQDPQGQTLESGIRKVSLVFQGPLDIKGPQDGAVFSYRGEKPIVRFSWNESPWAQGYQVLISKTPDMGSLVATVNSDGAQVSYRELGEGEYWWQVKGLYSFQGASSIPLNSPRKISLTALTEIKPPEVLLPADGAKYYKEDVQDSGVQVVWQNPEGAGVEFLLSRDAQLQDLVSRNSVQGNNFSLPRDLSPGTYFYQVRGVDSTGKGIPGPGVRSFAILDTPRGTELNFPEDRSISEANPLQGIPFSWTSPRGRGFILEVASEKEFLNSAVIQKTTQYNYVVPRLDPGTWFWRVKELDKAGSVVFITSPRSFTLEPPLTRPSLQNPPDGAALLLGPQGTFEFQWKAVPGAQSYDLQVFQGTKLLAQSLKIPENRVTLKRSDLGNPGELTWVLKAQAGSRSSSAGARFQWDEAPVLKEPEMVYPTQGQVVSGLENLRAGVVFQWKLTPPLSKVKLTVFKGTTGEEIVFQTTTEQSRLPLPGLAPGAYSWKLESFTNTGAQGPLGVRRNFSIGEIPVLPAPVPQFPRDAQVVDMTERASLNLSWARVPGAQYYEVRLFRAGAGAPLLVLSGVQGTEVVFQDLSKLDVGGFYWTVQAFNTDGTGAIFQKSLLRQVNFQITLKEAAGDIKITSPQVQYAE